MYFYASKISAIACGTRCKQTVLQKSRGQRDRDKCRHSHRGRCRHQNSSDSDTSADEACCGLDMEKPPAQPEVFSLDVANPLADTTMYPALALGAGAEGIRLRRRHSAEQLSAQDLELGFQQFEVGSLAYPRVLNAKTKNARKSLHRLNDY